MFIIKNYFLAFKNAGDFNGTTDNKEFWPFVLINSIITIWYLIFSYYNQLHYDVYTGQLLWFYLMISIPTITLTIRYLRHVGLPLFCTVILLVPTSIVVYVCIEIIPKIQTDSLLIGFLL